MSFFWQPRASPCHRGGLLSIMIHPNRAGYQAMALAIDVNLIAARTRQRSQEGR